MTRRPTSCDRNAQRQTARERARRTCLLIEPDGRSWTVRENLADILRAGAPRPGGRSGRGPRRGARTPRYLVGRIAPVRLTDRHRATRPMRTTRTSADRRRCDADAARAVAFRSTGVDDSAVDADEDDVEDQPQKRGLMIPASMGLRFQIPADLDDVHGDRVVGRVPLTGQRPGERLADGRSAATSAPRSR